MGQAVTRAVRPPAPHEGDDLPADPEGPPQPAVGAPRGEPLDPPAPPAAAVVVVVHRRHPPVPPPPPPPPPRPLPLHDARRGGGRLHQQHQYQQQHQQRRRNRPGVSRPGPSALAARVSPSVRRGPKAMTTFPDLGLLPPELGVTILSYLNATDLCLASCVWSELGSAELLWQGLCKSTWGYCSLYGRRPQPPGFSYRRLYLQLDEGRLTFNANADEGLAYLLSRSLVEDDARALARFVFSTRTLAAAPLRSLLCARRHDVLVELVRLHRFHRQFLPDALRRFLRRVPPPPRQRGPYLEALITEFSQRYCACNPHLAATLGLTADVVYVLCYSLILLSIDLGSPHVRNKMSKREFIRNTRRAAPGVSADFAGHLYDNVYLVGHVAS